MSRKFCLILVAIAMLLSSAIAQSETKSTPVKNPLLAKWTGPYSGVPPFDKVKVSDFKPALEQAMDENWKEIESIANDPQNPTFKNTIEALEHSGSALTRVSILYGIWGSTMLTDDMQAVETEMDPKLAAFNDKITQNEKLFKRIEAVYNSPEKEKLTPEQQRLTWLYYDNFVRYGAKLDKKAQARLAEINQKLAMLYTQFGQNLLADEGTVIFLKETDLDGLPQSLRDACAAGAEKRDHKGEWAILNTRSSVEPFLTYSNRRDLREKVWRAFVNRGDNGDSHDNNQIISEILPLRAERAKLLGYPTHAHWRVANRMAKTPENGERTREAAF